VTGSGVAGACPKRPERADVHARKQDDRDIREQHEIDRPPASSATSSHVCPNGQTIDFPARSEDETVPDILIRRQATWRSPRRELILAIPVLVIALGSGGRSTPVVFGLSALGAAVALAWTWYSRGKSTVGVMDSTLAYRRPLATRVIADVGSPVEIRRGVHTNNETGWQVWSGPSGAALFDERAWAPADLAALADSVGATTQADPVPADLVEVHRRYPTVGRWWNRHPDAAGALIVLAYVITAFSRA
jgi:hypothetical protein